MSGSCIFIISYMSWLIVLGLALLRAVSPQTQIESICDVESHMILFDDENLEKLRNEFRLDGGCLMGDWKTHFNDAVQNELREGRALDDKDKRLVEYLRNFERRPLDKSGITLKPPATNGVVNVDTDLVFRDESIHETGMHGIGKIRNIYPNNLRNRQTLNQFTIHNNGYDRPIKIPARSQDQDQNSERTSKPPGGLQESVISPNNKRQSSSINFSGDEYWKPQDPFRPGKLRRPFQNPVEPNDQMGTFGVQLPYPHALMNNERHKKTFRPSGERHPGNSIKPSKRRPGDFIKSQDVPGIPENPFRPFDENTWPDQGRPSISRPQDSERLPSTTTVGPPTWATPTSPCVRRCPNTPEYNPVCGSDDVTYRNPGNLRCEQGCGKVSVSLRYYGTCVTSTSRPLIPITSSAVKLLRINNS